MLSVQNAPSLTCTIHDSVLEVASSDWRAIVHEEDDLAMDRRLIAVQERTLRDQCRIWTLMLREADGTPAAFACACLFCVDGTLSAHPAASGAIEFARRAWPGLLRFNVLFCGLPAPPGESHVRIAPGADPALVMAALNNALRALAKKHAAKLTVFKEFGGRQSACAQWLTEHRYIVGDVPPMHRLSGGFRDFGHFLASMRSRYRAQVQRSRRKIESGGLAIEHHQEPRDIERAFTTQLHELYESVWRRSAYKLERIPREFIIDAARSMPGQSRLTVIRRGAAPVGFTFSMTAGRTWHNMYSGVDYAINGEGDILFNLFYADLDHAFSSGCADIRLGQTSDAFKARLGAVAEPLRFFVRAHSPVLHTGLRAFSAALFPVAAMTREPHVFKNGAAKEAAADHRDHLQLAPAGAT